MPSLEPPAVLAPKLVTTRPRSGQRNDGMPAVPAGPDSSACVSGVAIRALADGATDFTDCSVGPDWTCATCCGFADAPAPGAFLATWVAPALAGMVSLIPILSGVSGVMLLAAVSSRRPIR